MHCTYAHKFEVNLTLIQSQTTIDIFQEERKDRKRVTGYGLSESNNVSLEWLKMQRLFFVCV